MKLERRRVAALHAASRRVARPVAISTTAVLLLFAVATNGLLAILVLTVRKAEIGQDYLMYVDRARAWLSGDGFYLAHQLTGAPYLLEFGDATYPPVALWLMVPFTVLPAVYWWAVPLGIIGATLARVRPGVYSLPFLAFVLADARSFAIVVYGNPSMWALAALVAGSAWRWPAVFAVFKPTLALMALVNARHRGWWIGATGLLVLSLPFGSLWRDYVLAMANARLPSDYAADYLLGELPIAIALMSAVTLAVRRRSRYSDVVTSPQGQYERRPAGQVPSPEA